MNADNRTFDVNGQALIELKQCLNLVLLLRNSGAFKAYRIHDEYGLMLYEYVPSGRNDIIPFIGPQGYEATGQSVFDWLKSLKEEAFGKPGTHDGDNSRGWRAYTDMWGQIPSDHHAVIAIKPQWLWLGK